MNCPYFNTKWDVSSLTRDKKIAFLVFMYQVYNILSAGGRDVGAFVDCNYYYILSTKHLFYLPTAEAFKSSPQTEMDPMKLFKLDNAFNRKVGGI